MSLSPQLLGGVSGPVRPQVKTSQASETPAISFSAQLPQQPAPTAELTAKASPAQLQAQAGIKFAGSGKSLSTEQRRLLTTHLINTISEQNRPLYSFLVRGMDMAENGGNVTPSHLVYGMLDSLEEALRLSPKLLTKSASSMNATERAVSELLHTMMPSIKQNSLDNGAVMSLVKGAKEAVGQKAMEESLRGSGARDMQLFNEELILLLKLLEQNGGFSAHSMTDTYQTLSTYADSSSLSKPTRESFAVLKGLDEKASKYDAFDNIGGYNEVKREIKLWLRLLQRPEEAAEFGIKLEKGALLTGPPGTGKTLFARSIAKAVNGGFHAMVGSDFAKKYLGETAGGIKKFFADARKEYDKTGLPQVVFIDEIDAIGRKRGTGGSDGASAEMENALNTLLAEIDGVDENQNKGLIILGATNRQEILDPALTRSGRLGRNFSIDLPDEEARKAIFQVHSRNKPLDGEIDLDRWSELAQGMSGADIEGLMSEAAKVGFEEYISGRRSAKKLTQDDVLEAYKTKTVGQKNAGHTDPKDLELVVHHETFGHGALAYALGYKMNVVTSIGRGNAGGFVMATPPKGYERTKLKSQLENLVFGLAGQAAEENLAGNASGVTHGPTSDYQQARRQILQMISTGMIPGYGMSDYSGGYAGPQGELSKEDKELANYLLKRGRETALKVIKAIPQEVKDGIIEEAKGGIDYSFEDAADFYKRHLGGPEGPVVQEMRRIMDEYVEDVVNTLRHNAEYVSESFKKPKLDETPGATPPVGLTFSGKSPKANVVPMQSRAARLNVFS